MQPPSRSELTEPERHVEELERELEGDLGLVVEVDEPARRLGIRRSHGICRLSVQSM